MRGKPRIPARDAVLLLLALVAPLLTALRGSGAPTELRFELGPNDDAYLRGFDRDYEIDGLTATRWTSREAAIRLPLELRDASVEVGLRLARMLPETAVVDVLLDGRPIDRFSCRGGTWLERSVRVAAPGRTPLELELRVDSHDRRGLGVRLDWLRVRVSQGRVLPAGFALAAPFALVAGAFLAFRLGGLGSLASALPACAAGVAFAAWFARDPLAAAHVAAQLAPGALLPTLLAALIGRSRPGGPALAPVVLAGYLLKGALVCHPSFFYPDAQLHRRYVQLLGDASGGATLLERGARAQAQLSARVRVLAGSERSLPYSPLFFVPFLGLGDDPGPIEDALRHAGLLAAAAEPIAVYGLGLLLLGPAGALAGAAVSACLPPLFSRLLFAMWPTLAGHLLDLVAIGAALFWLRRPESARRLLLLAAAVELAFLTYIASLFNLGAFLAALALVERRRAKPLLALLLGTGLATVLLLYAGFSRDFLTQIAPALLHGAGPAAAGPPPGGLREALGRVPLFYGWGYPALAVAGLLLVRRRGDAAGRSVIAAYALAFLALVLLRGLLPGLFRDLKEITFAAPLVALGTGASLEALARRGRGGAWAAALVAAGLLAFSGERALFYFRSYRPPYMLAPASPVGEAAEAAPRARAGGRSPGDAA